MFLNVLYHHSKWKKKSLIKELIGKNKTGQNTKQGSEFSYF